MDCRNYLTETRWVSTEWNWEKNWKYDEQHGWSEQK